jgi:hypothetical protein
MEPWIHGPVWWWASALFLAAVALSGPLSAQAGDQEGRLSGPSIFAGRVVDHESGRPVVAAEVSLDPGGIGGTGAGTRASGEDGSFRFDDVPPGSYVLVVTSLSYRRFEYSLEVEPESEIRMLIRLSPSPVALEPLIVVAPRRPACMDGFEERRAQARAHTRFLTREEIQEMTPQPRYIPDLFRYMPGADVSFGPLPFLTVDANVAVPRNCQPDVWVNGRLLPDPGAVDLIDPFDIAAIELHAIEHDTPSEFRGPGRCGALVVWLRTRDPGEERPSRWKAFFAGLGALVLAFVLTR